MSDYISREAAYQFFKDQLEEETGAYRKGRNAGLRVAMSAVMNNDAIPAADAIEELSKPRWIPVTERLPQEYVNVLVFLHSLDWNSIYYSIDHLMEDGQWWKASTSWKHEVTHWMPLPEPPKEE